MSKPNTASPTAARPTELPALPLRRARRRTTRPSHSWCFRAPPSRKRVAVTSARGLPEPAAIPPQSAELQPRPECEH